MKKILAVAFLAACLSFTASAQRWSVGTNAVQWANLGTINVEAGAAVAQHVSLDALYRYNPWTFHSDDAEKQFEYRQQTYRAGIRIWPWYIYSGWWMGLAGQYQEYNRGGYLTKKRLTEEGDAFGGVLSAGYTLMIHERWNLEFGAAVWAGKTKYTTYQCPQCGRVVETGSKFFFLPDDLMLSLVYIF